MNPLQKFYNHISFVDINLLGIHSISSAVIRLIFSPFRGRIMWLFRSTTMDAAHMSSFKFFDSDSPLPYTPPFPNFISVGRQRKLETDCLSYLKNFVDKERGKNVLVACGINQPALGRFDTAISPISRPVNSRRKRGEAPSGQDKTFLRAAVPSRLTI